MLETTNQIHDNGLKLKLAITEPSLLQTKISQNPTQCCH